MLGNRRPTAVRRFPSGCGRHHNAAAAVGPPPYHHQLPTTAAAAAAAETKPTLNLAMPASSRRPPAVRRFPPGCGRPHNAAAGPPSYHQLPTTAAAATNAVAAPPPASRTLPATAFFGAEAPNPGVGNGGSAAAAVTVPRVSISASAVRRYPPGCGRAVALSKPKPPENEDGAGKPSAVVGGHGEAKARAWVDGEEVMLRASALDRAEFSSNGGMTNGGGGEAGAQEEGDGKPWEVSGLMAIPFLPWAQHERRSQRASS